MLGAGALVWTAFDGDRAPQPLLRAIREGHVGGIVLFAYRGNVRSADQVRAMLDEIQGAALAGGLPPVPIAVDQEGGSVVRIGYRAVFPSAMAMAAAGDVTLVERAARAVARGLRADGIAVNLAPVCDVVTDPRNTVIGTRSFGDDPARVAMLAAAWVRASQAEGVAAIAKHFPGHGAVASDPHTSFVAVATDRRSLDERELVPFRAVFTARAAGVMTAHVRYTALDDAAPATLSSAILTGILREELRYDGLCVTDALEMAGAGVDTPQRVIVRAIEAGADVVGATGPLEHALAAAEWIERGVRADRRAVAVARAAAFRDRWAIRDRADADDGEARALASEIAARAITHLGPPLPRLDGTVRAVVLAPLSSSPVEELSDPVSALERRLRARFGERLRFSRGAPPDGDGPLVVLSFGASHSPARAAQLRSLLANADALCVLRTPYDAALAPDRPALLSYSDVPASLDALVGVLAGERAATGRLPVRL